MNQSEQRVARIQALRRSNAATAVPSRKTRRQGTRATVRRAAVRADAA